MEAIRRVISGEDMMTGSIPSNDDDAIGMQIDDDDDEEAEYTPSRGPVLVEGDAADFHIASASETPRSSLSDMSAAQRLGDPYLRDEYDDDIEQEDQPQAPSTIRRAVPGQQGMSTLDPKSTDRLSDESSSVGKAGGSQTSSRDWGWFEDVHGSDGALASKESPSSRSGKRYKDTSTMKKKKSPSTITSSLLPSRGQFHETLQPIVSRDPETGKSRIESLVCPPVGAAVTAGCNVTSGIAVGGVAVTFDWFSRRPCP